MVAKTRVVIPSAVPEAVALQTRMVHPTSLPHLKALRVLVDHVLVAHMIKHANNPSHVPFRCHTCENAIYAVWAAVMLDAAPMLDTQSPDDA